MNATNDVRSCESECSSPAGVRKLRECIKRRVSPVLFLCFGIAVLAVDKTVIAEEPIAPPWMDDFNDGDTNGWTITNPEPENTADPINFLGLTSDPVDPGNICLRFNGQSGGGIGGRIDGPLIDIDLAEPYALTFDIYWTGFHWFRLSRFEHIAPVLDYPHLPMQMWTNQGDRNRHVFVGPPVNSYLPSHTWKTMRFVAIPSAEICHLYVDGDWIFTHDLGVFYSPVNGVRLSDPGKAETSDWFKGYVDNFVIEAVVLDCDTNGIPDICELDCYAVNPLSTTGIQCYVEYSETCGLAEDCNGNLLPDACESLADCNTNGVQDICEIAEGLVEDCNDNSIPDDCEPFIDCNSNEMLDVCDIAGPTSSDCNYNEIPDECEDYNDCNTNGIADICDIGQGSSNDCNFNGVPDDCEPHEDCNSNGVMDSCDLEGGLSEDCNLNGIPDECDISSGFSFDCQTNGIPDECDGREVLSYKLVFMGGLEEQTRGIARDINESGQAVGAARTDSGHWHAFIWEEGGDMIDLHTMSGFDSSYAYAINDEGWVVGTYYNSGHNPRGFIWKGGDMIDLGDLGGYASPYDINNLGQVVGRSNGKAFLWEEGVMMDLGKPAGDWWAEAYGINDAGQVVGRSGGYSESSHAFVWDPVTGFTDLGAMPPSFPGSLGRAINDFGHVAGYFYNYNTDIEHAFLWRGPEQMYDINALGLETRAYDINNYDEVVGAVDNDGFFWRDGEMVYLDDLVDYAVAGGRMWDGWGINDMGQIVGEGAFGSYSSVALMITPEYTADCDGNGIPDECEYHDDYNENGIPDICEPFEDCNTNGIADLLDIALGTSEDANDNGIPDECETDCNGNGVPDELDLAGATSDDCNGNAIPDECDVDFGTSLDCNGNLVPDECEEDCNGNGIPDECDITAGDGYNVVLLQPLVSEGVTYAYDLNNALQAVGDTDIGSSNHRGIIWESLIPTDLGKLVGTHSEVYAYAINSNGTVVGRSGAGSPKWAFIWDAIDGMSEVPGLGGDDNIAWGINQQEKVVGQAELSTSSAYHAFLWEDGVGTIDLDTLGGTNSVAHDINDSDVIVGWSQNFNGYHRPVMWAGGGSPFDLGTLGGNEGEAVAVNSTGLIVGWAENSNGKDRAFLYIDDAMVDLGTVGGRLESWASDINSHGDIVGKSDFSGTACRWKDGVGADLNQLIPPGSDWVLYDATAINDNGWIVGWGNYKGVRQAFLLVPGTEDCNSNGVPDECDISGDPNIDCNGTGIPDECENLNGDYDADGDVDLDDYAAFADCLAGPELVPGITQPQCAAACKAAFDLDGDGDVDLADFAQLQILYK